MQIALKDTYFALRNSTTRIPFRYGAVSMTYCPQAILQVDVEVDGKVQTGYTGDCLPPGWFDKSPEKSYRQQIDDMLAVTNRSRAVFTEHLSRPSAFFPVWQSAQREVHQYAADRDLPALLAGFGFSLVERAILDAAARAKNVPFHTLIQDNALDITPGKIHSELSGFTPSDWIQQEPLTSIYVRHTVGLSDPLTTNDVVERPPDPFPVIIDESDGELNSCREAFAVGYRGITSKSCKGAIKAILNAGLVWYHNQQAKTQPFVMTGEDLCCVGVVPLQSDLCLAATLGLGHVERNGHHYHPGLSYLSRPEQEAALAAHPDLYHQQQGIIAPHVRNGRFQMASLQCSGFGFAAIPDMKSMQAVEEWSFDSLQN